MKAKKSYGQHFLKDEHAAQRIATSLQLRPTYSKLLEVGPGMGMLTKYLLAYADEHQPEVWVSEADRDMVTYVREHFPQLAGHIIEGDFLQADLRPYFGQEEQFALIGNFPYNISSQILFRMLDFKRQIPEMVGMFQLEVAERIAAAPNSKTYGVISVLLQAFYTAKVLFQVKPTAFNPPPKVQSAVIRMERKASLDLGCDEKLFRAIVKVSFGQRRKMLRNTLATFLPKDLLAADDSFTRRPENLSVADFVALTRRVQEYRATQPNNTPAPEEDEVSLNNWEDEN